MVEEGGSGGDGNPGGEKFDSPYAGEAAPLRMFISVSERGCGSGDWSKTRGSSLGVPRRCALVTFVGVLDLSLLMSSQLCAVSSLSFRDMRRSESDGFLSMRGLDSPCKGGSAPGLAVGVVGWDLNLLNHFRTPSRFIGSLPNDPDVLGEMAGGAGVLK